MALRELEVDGTRWTVWDVRPQVTPDTVVLPGLERGWLAMQSGTEKRRIFPMPCDWVEWDDDELAEAVREAKPPPPVGGECSA